MTSVDFLKSYLGTVLGFYKGIFDGIVKGVNVVLGMIGKLVGAIKSIPSLPNIGGAIGGLIGKIPGLAEGGIVTSPTLAMIGEGGEPEAVIPLSKMNGMGSVTININSAVADANLGDIIVNALKQYNRRSGPVQVQIA
jgi:phage-related protein